MPSEFLSVTSGLDISQRNTGCGFMQLYVTLGFETISWKKRSRLHSTLLLRCKNNETSTGEHTIKCNGISLALFTLNYFDTFMRETQKNPTRHPNALNPWATKPVPFFRERIISDGQDLRKILR